MNEQNGCVVLSDGWVLHLDGTLQENSTSGYGTIKRPENEHEKSKLIVMFWQKKLELSIAEFDDKKVHWLASARNSLGREGNPGGTPVETTEAVGILNTLKAKVDYAKEMLAEAEQKLEKSTPTQKKKDNNISEENRQRLGDFVGTIERIEI